MIDSFILDTGPLVGFLDRHDNYHGWCRAQFEEIKPPFFTCEAVISEACFLLKSLPMAVAQIKGYLERQLIRIEFSLSQAAPKVFALMRKYADIQMSLADACLVQMVDELRQARVLTLDGDFRFYRSLSRRIIPVLMPVNSPKT